MSKVDEGCFVGIDVVKDMLDVCIDFVYGEV